MTLCKCCGQKQVAYTGAIFCGAACCARWEARQSAETGLPRIPEGYEGAGYINNCALANGDLEENCQMCNGTCPDRHRFKKENT